MLVGQSSREGRWDILMAPVQSSLRHRGGREVAQSSNIVPVGENWHQVPPRESEDHPHRSVDPYASALFGLRQRAHSWVVQRRTSAARLMGAGRLRWAAIISTGSRAPGGNMLNPESNSCIEDRDLMIE